MAVLIMPNGAAVVVSAGSRPSFDLSQLQGLVGGFIESVPLADGRTMFVDEDGKTTGKARNDYATDLLRKAGGHPSDFVTGNALVCSREEVE